MGCTIELSSLQVEPFDAQIFHFNNRFIVNKRGQYLYFENCSGEQLSEVTCPYDARTFTSMETDDYIVLVVGGRTVITFDKNGFDPIVHQVDQYKVGRMLTDIHPAGDTTMLVGTTLSGRAQFVLYDYINGTTSRKSQYWQTPSIDSLIVEDETAYAILNKTFIASLGLDCETRWSRFESGIIAPPLVPFKDKIAYVSGEVVGLAFEGKSQSVPIPRFSPSKIISASEDVLYLLADGNKTLIAYNPESNEVLWEITGSAPVMETLPIKGRVDRDIVDAVLVRYSDYIAAVDLTHGRKMAVYSIGDAYLMSQSSDHVFINRRGNKTDVIKGIV